MREETLFLPIFTVEIRSRIQHNFLACGSTHENGILFSEIKFD